MLVRLSRILLVILVIIVTAIYLPYFYRMAFDEYIRTPFMLYSPILEEVLVVSYEDGGRSWLDQQGNVYTLEQGDSLIPLFNYRQLTSRGEMPDSVKGIKIDLDEVRLNNFFDRIRPGSINAPEIPLYPLFESKPKRVNLEMPKEFFRITDRMEFISAATNEIIPDLTESFTKALRNKNFQFPAKMVRGNPTTRKPYDAGYFVLDNADKLFHIKMIDGRPFCKNTNFPQDVKIKTIFVKERQLRESYGVVISEDNQLYMLMTDDYRLVRVPLEHYVPEHDYLRFMGNIFNRQFMVIKENKVYFTVTNRDYEVIDRYEESWKSMEQRTAGIVRNYLFPFTLDLHSEDSAFVNFNLEFSGFNVLFFNILLLLITIGIFIRTKRPLTDNWLDLIIVVITGIYGFIAILLFERPQL